MTQDMTEHKQAEEALQASEERFRRYFDLGLIGMAITSPTKGILEVNDELCRILGYERGELLQKTWAELTHPDDLVADLAQFNRVMTGEMDGYRIDKRWIRADGRIIDSVMAAQCVRRADGFVDYFVGLVLDTTERKLAEERLRRSEANLAEGQRLSHTGSWAWNISTDELFWSKEHYHIFGLDPEGVKPTKESTQHLIHPEDRAKVEEALTRAVQDRSDFEMDFRIALPDGTLKYLHTLAHPVFREFGALAEYVGTVIDITERKRAEETLQKLQLELAHVTRMTTMGELAAWIAHEINQPLGAIVNNGNACLRLLRDAPAQDDVQQALADIVDDANRASAVSARIRALMKRSSPEQAALDFRDVDHQRADAGTARVG